MKKRPGRQYTSREIWGYHEDTSSELKLSRALKKAGVAFEREVPIDRFTVDFLVDEWLIVEVDGWSHLTSSRQSEDRKRQTELESWGFSVIRIPAMEISHRAGLKRWVNKLVELSKQGPPRPARTGFEDIHLKQQVDKARHELMERARRIGLNIQRRKRQAALSLGGSGDGTDDAHSGPEETMDDYFGPEAGDFGKLLEGYDWSKAPDKEETDVSEERQKAYRRRRHR
ncbi:MAG: DUF559 domain-containing protein [Firmicutes bacterium]|jgi:very-short-patch-repair endonuclease|nr:DUF559 domain-containing protein [Candidatus Fermentithermobacillaceae bacterium]